jgi:hypothetical protein
MTPTRVTADEIKARMDRGEVFTCIDARNPQAWGDSERAVMRRPPSETGPVAPHTARGAGHAAAGTRAFPATAWAEGA